MKQCPKCDGEMVGKGKHSPIVIKVRVARMIFTTAVVLGLVFEQIFVESSIFYVAIAVFVALTLAEIFLAIREGKNGYECSTCGYFVLSKTGQKRNQRSQTGSLIQAMMRFRCPTCNSRKIKARSGERISLKTGQEAEQMEMVCTECGHEFNFNKNDFLNPPNNSK